MDQVAPDPRPRGRHGLVLGKFMPPHRGHVYLVDAARRQVDSLTVLVCSLQREPIPGELRHRWMRELFAGSGVQVVHVTDEVPQEPAEHPDFWSIWQELIRRHVPQPIDRVFASEDYGPKLAKVLDARFVPVDPGRQAAPVSGTAIRADPMKHWRFLPDCVRPHFVKRVCVFGPESTGKSTLTLDLARHFDTVAVPEFARTWLDPKQGRCDYDDLDAIALGQDAGEAAMARHANRVMFCDTDALTTTIWAQQLFGRCPAWIEALARQRAYDLTLLLDVDVPWVDDTQRYLPHARQQFFDRCEQALRRHGRRYEIIRGDWEQRRAQAVQHVEPLLDQPPGR